MTDLDTLRVASPCKADWNQMLGDERVRFCGLCQKNVYNVSGMTRQEAVELVEANTGSLCLRMYKRADGTVLTADCPVGEKEKKKKVRRLSMVAAGVAAGLAAFAGVAMAQSRAETGKLTAVDDDDDDTARSRKRIQPPAGHMMGAMPAHTEVPSASPPPKPPPVVTAEPRVMMGDVGEPAPAIEELGEITEPAPKRAPAIDPPTKNK